MAISQKHYISGLGNFSLSQMGFKKYVFLVEIISKMRVINP